MRVKKKKKNILIHVYISIIVYGLLLLSIDTIGYNIVLYEICWGKRDFPFVQCMFKYILENAKKYIDNFGFRVPWLGYTYSFLRHHVLVWLFCL